MQGLLQRLHDLLKDSFNRMYMQRRLEIVAAQKIERCLNRHFVVPETQLFLTFQNDVIQRHAHL